MSSRDLRVYSQCGLRLRSELELHLPLDGGGAWDVDVHWGPDMTDSAALPPGDVVAAYGSEEDRWYTGTSTESGYLLRFRGCGEFEISADLSDVQIRKDVTGRTALLSILMAGTVSAFLLTLRGATVLHASAVALDGAALAFVGQSGRGKSTLATLMCLAGADLVTDDVLVVDAGSPVTCIGGAAELRLREGASSLAEGRPTAAARRTADDRTAVTMATKASGALPLAAVVVPTPSRTASDVEVVRLPPSTAIFWLLAFPRIQGWCLPEVLSRDFSVLSHVVNNVPLYNVTVPWGPPFDPSVAASLATLVHARE